MLTSKKGGPEPPKWNYPDVSLTYVFLLRSSILGGLGPPVTLLSSEEGKKPA